MPAEGASSASIAGQWLEFQQMGFQVPKHHRLTQTPMQLRQDVVILGTGAFALEAMEAADRGSARSITLIARPRDRQVQTPVLLLYRTV